MMMKKLIVLSSIILAPLCLASTQENEDQKKQQKPITIYPGESQRIADQKEAGILQGERDYSEKSDFVKNRDRTTGTIKQVAEDVKKTVKHL
jgi:hypothetical protein